MWFILYISDSVNLMRQTEFHSESYMIWPIVFVYVGSLILLDEFPAEGHVEQQLNFFSNIPNTSLAYFSLYTLIIVIFYRNICSPPANFVATFNAIIFIYLYKYFWTYAI